MAVETTTAFSGPYTANGATTTFGFTFIAKAADEIGVLLRDSDGVDSVVSTSAYTVTLNANGTGSVVFTTAPASGNSVYIYSDVSFQQSIDFEDGTGWKAAPVNEASDRAALRDIYLKNKADRSLVVPYGETGFTLPTAAERQGLYLAFDADGDVVTSSGTGADAGLRADLAGTTGAALIGTANGETAQAALDNKVTKVATQTALTALTKATLVNGQVFETLAAKAAGDQGGAVYQWDASATDTVNDGTILDNDAGGNGRYKYVGRAGPEVISTAQFGVSESGITNLERKNRLQKAITAAYGKKLVINHSGLLDYDSSSGAELEIDVSALAAAGGMEISGLGVNASNLSGIRNVGNGIGLKIHNSTGTNYNGDLILRRFAIWGDNTNANGGNLISLDNMNARTVLDNLDCFGARENAVYAEDCFSLTIIGGIYNQSRKSNIRLKNAANRVKLERVTSFGAGRIMSGEYANIEIDGSTSTCYAPVIDACDFSYSANDPFQVFKRSDSSLTNISVTANVPTITTAAAHGLTTGDKVCIMGATVAPTLNSVYAFGVTVTGANTFTLPYTPAGNGTYTESTLKVVPASHGLLLNACKGVLVNSPYCEEPALNAIFLSGASDGFVLTGGEFLDGRTFIDGPIGGKILGGYYHGTRAGLTIATTNRHEIDVSGVSTDTGTGSYNEGVTKIDGRYRASAMPSAGSWVAGDFVENSAPAIDGSNMLILGWKRLTTGSGHVSGTDWAISRASTVSPAT